MQQSLKHAVRQLIRSPGFTVVAIVMLALGIGMSTSAFSVTSAVLFRSLPFPNGERLMRIYRTSQGGYSLAHSPANYLYLKSSTTTFTDIAAFWWDTKNMSWPGHSPSREEGIGVTDNFLATLGVHPLLGSDFATGDDRGAGMNTKVMLTNSFWKAQFGGDPSVIGRTVRLGVFPITIIGVLPPTLDDTPPWGGVSFVRPLTVYEKVRAGKWFNLIGRLRPATPMATAEAELVTLMDRTDHDYPQENGSDSIRITGLAASNTTPADRRLYWLTVGLALLVLAIACANLASVQLARAFGRRHEFAVRAALGASRFNLMGPLVTECLLLAAAGGIGGIMVAAWTNRLISHFSWDGYRIPIDGKIIGFAIGVSLLTGLAFSLAPSWLAAGIPTADGLKENSRSGTAGLSKRKLRATLVMSQLALAVVLVSAALTFWLAIAKASKADYGWQPSGLVAGFLDIDVPAYNSEAQRLAFLPRLRAQLAQVAGISDVTLSTEAPTEGFFGQGDTNFVVEGQPAARLGSEPFAQTVSVDANFFRTLRIPFRAGSTFDQQVGPTDPKVIVINETMARALWPGQSAVGKRIRFVDGSSWSQVVGVVGDFRYPASFKPPLTRFQVYKALPQALTYHYQFILRCKADPSLIAAAARRAVSTVDPDLMLSSAGGVQQGYDQWFANNDLTIASLSAFAFSGVFIALIGLYGVMSQMTAQRGKEIGIRIALGADYFDVIRLVVSQGGRLILLGVAVGVMGALGVNLIYQHAMPELALPGPTILAGIAVALITVGLAACLLPARKAAAMDPVRALRLD